MQDSNTSSKDHTPNTTPSKLKFDDKYATPESPDTFPYVHGNMNLNAPGTGTKVIQRCMTDLDDLISRRKKELSDIQHSGLKSSHKKKSAIELRNDIKPIPMGSYTTTPGRKIKESDADIKRDLHIVEEEESAFSETLEELLMHSESHNTTKVTTTTVTHSHLHFDLGDGNCHNNHHNKTAEEEELHELRHLYKTSQSKIALLEEKIVQMELHVEANMTGNSQRAKLQAEERTKLQALRAQLEDELSSANEELQFLRVQLQNKSARVLDLETELTAAQREAQDLRNKMEEDAEALKRLGSSRSLFEDEPILKNVSSDDKINGGKEPAIQLEVVQLQEQLAALTEEVNSLQVELAMVKSEYENVVKDKKAAVQAAADEKTQLQSKVKELEYSLKQADARAFESEVAAAEAENKLEDLEKKTKEKVEQMKKELVALKKMNDTLQEEIKELQKKNKGLVNEGNSNDEIIAELKKQHNNELQKAKNALTALADKHALQLAELKAQHEREKEQQLSDALMAVADVSDLNVNVPGAKGKGSAPPTPTPSAAAAASPPSPVRQTMAMEPVEIPAPAAVVVVKKPSSTGFYLGLAMCQATVWAVLLFLAFMYINHVDLVTEFPIRLVPYRYTS